MEVTQTGRQVHVSDGGRTRSHLYRASLMDHNQNVFIAVLSLASALSSASPLFSLKPSSPSTLVLCKESRTDEAAQRDLVYASALSSSPLSPHPLAPLLDAVFNFSCLFFFFFLLFSFFLPFYFSSITEIPLPVVIYFIIVVSNAVLHLSACITPFPTVGGISPCAV